MVGHDEGDVHRQVASLVAGEEVVETVIFLGHEKGDALTLAGEVEAHLHFMTPSHGLETGEDLLFLQGEVLQTPLEAHEKGVLIGIDVLLEVDDVSSMGEDESRDIMDQTWAVGTMDKKRGGVGHEE